MDSGTGNVKITHHVKFLPTKFPLLKIGDTSAHHHSFTLVPNETETLPIKDNAILNDPNIQSEEEISQKNLKNPLIQTQQPSVKRYLWVPENESIPQNEILGDVSYPRNILTHQRQQKHYANLADNLSLNPKTYQEAINRSDSQEWQNAIKVELTNMTTHNVWSPARTDQNIKPLSTTWVFKQKTDEDGNLSKYKARQCIRGFNQKEGIDYLEVFSPTGRLSSLRLLLTLFHIHKYPIEQMDVGCAFLNGKPEETLHIFRPPGYFEYPETDIFVLNKSLYGLKQSPCCWHKVLKNTLISIGLTPCFTDPCLFYSQDRSNAFLLFIHVDDLIFGGTWNEKFKNQIKTFFEMEDLGNVKYALGIRIKQNKEYISLIQDKFVHQILTEFNVNQVQPPSAPLPSNYKDLKNLEGKPVEPPPFNFRRAVGLIQYLVQCTQTDLSFATSFLSQFLENPKYEHYKAVVHTLKYLSGTRQFTLNLGRNLMIHPDSQIYGFTNSDWGGGTEKKSFSGSLFYFHGALGWRAHKQKVVALSSAKAEYNALTKSAQDLSCIKQLIYESTNKEVSCILHSDNKSAIAIASNPIYHHRTRNIDF
ncbi:hypothetical protein O181_106214 [Austropuccinia psidii MF-1]|uniref:Reverse transcriptase Ty1/copia-type domain-containing protein n=1 Tax=Austropuccinia psidii MF-1 TaxID=1389203 RepID=A0A9Q3JRN9_9BASI|nr:hypothetical protein [Austropuccinia psidii MF-1]